MFSVFCLLAFLAIFVFAEERNDECTEMWGCGDGMICKWDKIQVRYRCFPYYGETPCDDGIDNDDDGFTDCVDWDCRELPICTTESKCDDGYDNDLDYKTDCADEDCEDDPYCVWEDCVDGADNDYDGLIDCLDPDCEGMPHCYETECSDGIDNDRDKLKDCADPDCEGMPGCIETKCTDKIDNDKDGLTDCMDLDCEGKEGCIETECSDGIDNEGDLLIDCDDPDCFESIDCQGACTIDEDCILGYICFDGQCRDASERLFVSVTPEELVLKGNPEIMIKVRVLKSNLENASGAEVNLYLQDEKFVFSDHVENGEAFERKLPSDSDGTTYFRVRLPPIENIPEYKHRFFPYALPVLVTVYLYEPTIERLTYYNEPILYSPAPKIVSATMDPAPMQDKGMHSFEVDIEDIDSESFVYYVEAMPGSGYFITLDDDPVIFYEEESNEKHFFRRFYADYGGFTKKEFPVAREIMENTFTGGASLSFTLAEKYNVAGKLEKMGRNKLGKFAGKAIPIIATGEDIYSAAKNYYETIQAFDAAANSANWDELWRRTLDVGISEVRTFAGGVVLVAKFVPGVGTVASVTYELADGAAAMGQTYLRDKANEIRNDAAETKYTDAAIFVTVFDEDGYSTTDILFFPLEYKWIPIWGGSDE